jgi:UDP-galactopyranose mutase
MRDLICISHLRWNFVWQRPQHILSRLAQQYRVFFVEEPILSAEAQGPYIDSYVWEGKHDEKVTVLRLVQPHAEPHWVGHGDPLTSDTYCKLLREYFEGRGTKAPALWLYTPMALEFVDALDPSLLVYDVMDQLSAFKGAPAALKRRDVEVLRQADIVFTGGVSLYRSKLPYNPSTYLLPSGVEIEHFARAACASDFACPNEIAHLNSPILGYFGVIDERMDLPLLEYLTSAHRDWNLLMIGPVVKIDAAELPQAPNLHYLGMRSYEQLPAYLARFDVALVPFAMNDATRYLSPTKTLEYMAAHKPIVSTPIHDVIELYGTVVRIGHTPEDFVRHIERILADPNEAAARRSLELSLLEQHTWNAIAERMSRLIELKYQPARASASPVSAAR